MSLIGSWSFMLLALGYASDPPAEAIEATQADVLRGGLCVDAKYADWKAQPPTVEAAGCKPVVVDEAADCASKFKLDLSTCWMADKPLLLTSADVTLTIRPPSIEPCKHPLVYRDGLLQRASDAAKMPGPYGGTLLYPGAEGSRVKVDAVGGVIADPAKVFEAKGKLLMTFDGGSLCEVDREKLVARPAKGDVKAAKDQNGGQEDLDEVRAEFLERCFVDFDKSDRWLEKRRRRRETVCVWTDGERFVTLLRPRRLLPGQPLRFVLIAPKTAQLRAKQEGTIGYEVELDDQVGNIVAASPARGGADATSASATSVWMFEGRAAGPASIVLLNSGDKEVHRVEIQYPKTYFGSLRVGLAVVGLGAVRPEYAAVQRDGSMTHEVAQKAGGRLAFEVVLAYSIYPEAMLGGRDYTQRLFSRNNWGVGPVFGLGVVSVDGSKIQALRSVYLGVEFEPVRFFSISVGPVFRRVDLLADGYRVGSGLPDAKVPIKERVAVGGFLMINFTPQFFKTRYDMK